jgi:kojibiose phosphorylase
MRRQLSEAEWLIEEADFDIARANVFETLFTIGNGYLGTRGTLEEGHRGELSGTYLNGVFDAHDAPVIDLVNAPDWLSVVVHAHGVRLDVQTCKIVSHQRALDLRQGALWRETVFEDMLGRRTRIETLRFASFADQSLCALRIAVTPENHDGPVTVESAIDGCRRNLERLPAYADTPVFPPEVKWEKWAKSLHLRQVAASATPACLYLEMQTIGSGIHIGYASTLMPSVLPVKSTPLHAHERVAERHEFFLSQGQTLSVDKFTTIRTSRDMPVSAIETTCQFSLAALAVTGFDAALAENRRAWAAKWDDCDAVVVGDAAATQAVRFNIYHLLITANGNDPRANIGAKSLSGEGYRGHVFWDTEIFMLPFYIYTQPQVAKALLMYRYNTLDGARANARANGFRGAQYAWESADTGEETTPKWTADGKHRIWTGEEEIHVTADVAYGVLTYVTATGDTAFMADCGAEILFETSRFWISRLEEDGGGGLVLTRVIGPDEFHEHVDNNAFTNRMAQWHLVQAARIHDELAAQNPGALARLAGRIGLMPGEAADWRAAAARILIPFDADRGLIEQFAGYLSLKEVPVSEWDDNDMPCYPAGYDHFNAGETTLLKQPDVVMLMYVLPDEFSDDAKRANYAYYEPRTLHKSSLSPAIHSIMGIEVGDTARALQYFRRSALVDLANNQGNTQDGIHAASAGGTWQALVFGFGGFRVLNGRMTFRPWLPPGWTELRFRLCWQGSGISVRIGRDEASFLLDGGAATALTIGVAGQDVVLQGGRVATVALNREVAR